MPDCGGGCQRRLNHSTKQAAGTPAGSDRRVCLRRQVASHVKSLFLASPVCCMLAAAGTFNALLSGIVNQLENDDEERTLTFRYFQCLYCQCFWRLYCLYCIHMVLCFEPFPQS